MLARIYSFLASLSFGLWLMVGVIILLAIGSFSGGGAEASAINDMALFAWLREAPLAWSWWLWIAIALLALLGVNTVLCSVDSLRSKWQRARFLSLVAPQIMHAGFLLIVIAHLFSAYGGQKGVLQVAEGQVVGFPDGSGVAIANISGVEGPMGMLTSYQAEIIDNGGNGKATAISPNRPFFRNGYGLYLKDVQLFPQRIALVEVHREPGAGPALAGAIFFTVGNLALLTSRRGRREG